MKTVEKRYARLAGSSVMNRIQWARFRQWATEIADNDQTGNLAIPCLYRLELSLADLEAERLFARNHRGEYCHTGVGVFQYTNSDFV